MRRKLGALFLPLLLAACAIETPSGGATVQPDVSGEQVFVTYCGLCHGENGEGHINALDANAINADGETYLLSDAEIQDIILSGTLESGGQMPPMANQLSEAQVSAVIAYLPTLWTAEQQAAHAAANGQ